MLVTSIFHLKDLHIWSLDYTISRKYKRSYKQKVHSMSLMDALQIKNWQNIGPSQKSKYFQVSVGKSSIFGGGWGVLGNRFQMVSKTEK